MTNQTKSLRYGFVTWLIDDNISTLKMNTIAKKLE